MKISGLSLYQPIFRAHLYKVSHKDSLIVVQTDNEKSLGNEPYIIYRHPQGEEERKMNRDGDLYSAKIYTTTPDFKYHILYKDTGNVDLKNGKEYEINPQKMLQKIAHDSRIIHKQPTIFVIKEGKTIGKIVYNRQGATNLKDIDEPTILITPLFSENNKNPNIIGIIYTAYDNGAFDHISTQLRQQTDVCGAIFEPEIIEKLISMNGKNVEIELSEGHINIQETNKKRKPKVYPQIYVPKLKPCNKILTSKEYRPDIIGAKAFNLKRLEKLKEQGKIDISIPKSIALPHGYIQEMFDENPSQEKEFNKHSSYYICKEKAYIPYKDEFCKNRMENLYKTLFNSGIVRDENESVMVRSAFNGEDLPNYSAAGIYRTTTANVNDFKSLYQAIMKVAQSKWEDNAIYSRKMHNIPDENIQFGVILQQRIMPDYKFTLYTDDGNGNLKIDLYSGLSNIFDNTVNPHIFTYNKKTNELSYDSIQLGNPIGIFDENQQLESIEPIENNLSDNKELFEQLKKVAKNAVAVEQEFGAPQDIEGGIKDNNIYFWQSRNIVR